jgi:glutamate-5-semialdehyde dehydrogenase
MSIAEIAAAAKAASIQLAAVKATVKNKALAEIAEAIRQNSAEIVSANKQDLADAGKSGLSAPLLKRLKFDEQKIADVRAGIESLTKIDDPVGRTISATELDEGLELYKVSCPIGVVGVIFESRPDALIQISTLCLKSGNAVLLKGGSEAQHTNKILAEVISRAAEKAGIPKGWLGLMESRAEVAEILKMDQYIDLLVPRGSNDFVRHIMDNTNIPVLGHAEGICHVYVDAEAELDMAVKIAVDSKCQYCAVCNAAETLLVDEKVAEDFLPRIKTALDQKNVEIRGCEQTASIIEVSSVTEQDWSTEYLDEIISIKVVGGLDEAIGHINRFGSGHTDAIVTANKANAAEFMDLVDSANVLWISTNKIHARGPVGMEGLLIYKWKLLGSGQIVADYSGSGGKKFTHKKLNKDCEL